MKSLIIINSILAWSIAIHLIIKPQTDKFSVQKEKEKGKWIGISITKWRYHRRSEYNKGRVIFSFNWINNDQ